MGVTTRTHWIDRRPATPPESGLWWDTPVRIGPDPMKVLRSPGPGDISEYPEPRIARGDR